MIDREENNLINYFITTFFGGIFTGPGGMFLSPIIFFLISRSNLNLIHKSKWFLWSIFGIFPFVFASYPSFVLSRNVMYTKEVMRDLNDQSLKCIISEFATERMKSQISPGNSLYKTYIPKGQNECTVYKSVPRNFKGGFRSILFWNHSLDATWFQIEIDQKTNEVEKICGDSSKPGCEEGNTW